MYVYIHTHIYTQIYININIFTDSFGACQIYFIVKHQLKLIPLNFQRRPRVLSSCPVSYISIPFKGVTRVGFLFGITCWFHQRLSRVLDEKDAKHALKRCHTCWNLFRNYMLIPLKFVPCVGCKDAKHALKRCHTCWNLFRNYMLIPLKFVPCVGYKSCEACPWRASHVLESFPTRELDSLKVCPVGWILKMESMSLQGVTRVRSERWKHALKRRRSCAGGSSAALCVMCRILMCHIDFTHMNVSHHTSANA